MAIKTLIQMPHQQLYNPIIERITSYRIHHRNIRKCYKNVYIISQYHSQHLLLYKLAEQSASSLDRLLEFGKCNILVITQACMLSLICSYICNLACVITYKYTYENSFLITIVPIRMVFLCKHFILIAMWKMVVPNLNFIQWVLSWIKYLQNEIAA